MKKVFHIIPHSHWDREWYQSFEGHRIKLVELFDAIIEEMEKSDEYTYYHMDGQFIPVEDYLEIRPEMRDRLQKLVKEDRIQIGPWYVLQDEYLISGEANVRNMLYGLKLSKAFGAKPVMTGYFPDSFGNVGQAPQICQGFGIDNAVFGRGLNDVGSDNQIIKQNGITKSELLWRAPDGSEVIGVMFTHWYSNANELPADPNALRDRLLGLGHSMERFAVTDHLLGMNGCDHQPLQRNLVEVIKTANEVQDEYEVKQSNFKDYIAEVRKYKDKLLPFEGEIAGQYTSGWGLLTSTASTHIDIKQLNHDAQHKLERLAEPASVLAHLSGGKYDSDFFLYAWRRLMQNHPHDSICTCSCDEVYDAMLARFASSMQVADKLTEEALSFFAKAVDTECGGDKAIVLLSLEPYPADQAVRVNIDFDRSEQVESVVIYDDKGNEVPAKLTLIRNQFTYTLPNDRFRQPRYVDRVVAEFSAHTENVGYRVYRVVKAASDGACAITVREQGMENEYLSLNFNTDGSFELTDKRTGRIFHRQNRIEDRQDLGESYNFRAGDDTPIYPSEGAQISLYETTAYSATFAVTFNMAIGAELTSYVTLTKSIARVDITTKINNHRGNHRIRALFDSDIATDHVLSEGQFDLVRRPIEPSFTWENPSNLQKTQAFIALEGDTGACLAIANQGICEYEILRNSHNTAAITLLRCVGEMGDWGVFPTSKAQCIGEYTLKYAVVPYCVNCKAEGYHTAYSFASPALLAVSTDCHNGNLPAASDYFSFDNRCLRLTACKKAEERDSLILRFFNLSENEQLLNITLNSAFNSAYLTNLNEDRQSALTVADGKLQLSVPKKKIITIELGKA